MLPSGISSRVACSKDCLLISKWEYLIGMIALAVISAKAIYGPEAKAESELP